MDNSIKLCNFRDTKEIIKDIVMDTIAVIVPVYNAEATLERCLSSFLNQNGGGNYLIIR